MNLFGLGRQAIQKIAQNPAADLAAAVHVLDEIEAGAVKLHAILTALPDGREKTLALTKLEEAILWGQRALIVAQTVEAIVGGAADTAAQ